MGKKFEYVYKSPSPEEREEIKAIQEEYLQENKKEKSKLDRLRELDRKVKEVPTVVSLILGCVGLLIFGLGLTMILEWNLLIYGIVVMILGCVPMIFAYFVHNKIYNKLKNKYSKEIVDITKELLNEQ